MKRKQWFKSLSLSLDLYLCVWSKGVQVSMPIPTTHPNELVKSFTGLFTKPEILGGAQVKAANETSTE